MCVYSPSCYELRSRSRHVSAQDHQNSRNSRQEARNALSLRHTLATCALQRSLTTSAPCINVGQLHITERPETCHRPSRLDNGPGAPVDTATDIAEPVRIQPARHLRVRRRKNIAIFGRFHGRKPQNAHSGPFSRPAATILGRRAAVNARNRAPARSDACGRFELGRCAG